MTRFEELQMRVAESAKNYLEVFNMQVFIEQFSLDRESRFSMTLPNQEPPFPVTATVSFTYDAFQTGMTLYEDDAEDASLDIDTSIEMEFMLSLPFMQGEPPVEDLLKEIEEEYPDVQPVLAVKEIISSDEGFREYEISYIYTFDAPDAADTDLFDQVFGELKEILELVHLRTKDYIDTSWYNGEE